MVKDLESYPNAPLYDHTSLKFNADGEQVAYLEGDIVKIPAHWDSLGSYIFLEAKADISRGVELGALFDNGQVGPNDSLIVWGLSVVMELL